jgi:hypothetical protein
VPETLCAWVVKFPNKYGSVSVSAAVGAVIGAFTCKGDAMGIDATVGDETGAKAPGADACGIDATGADASGVAVTIGDEIGVDATIGDETGIATGGDATGASTFAEHSNAGPLLADGMPESDAGTTTWYILYFGSVSNA